MINMLDLYYRRNTKQMMLLVLIACIPGISIEFYYFGYGVLLQILISVVTALLSELCILKIRNKIICNVLTDYSTIVTAVLFAISLPPFLVWWMNVIGIIFAIVVVKHIYGGLGNNIFNPAMSGYILLVISYPIFMTNWIPSSYLISHIVSFNDTVNIVFFKSKTFYNQDKLLNISCDGVTQATPLDKFKTDLRIMHTNKVISLPISIYDIFKNLMGWNWINIGFLFGGVFLLIMNVICWRVPFYFLLTLIVLSTIGWLFNKECLASPIFHLFTGSTMLGAFFIATDPVTMPISNTGKIFFSILIASLIWIIRSFGGYPDATAFAVLLANTTVPLIDYYSRSKIYGK